MISVEMQGRLAVILILEKHNRRLDPNKPRQAQLLTIMLQCFLAGYGAADANLEHVVGRVISAYGEVHTS